MHAYDLDPVIAARPHSSKGLDAGTHSPTRDAESLSAKAVLNLQRTAGNSSVSSLLAQETDEESPVRDVVGSGRGAPLDGATRAFMESHLGHDFGDVRIHTDSKADESAKAINAQAYTVGTDVVFSQGKFAPGTTAGMHTLAHELTHVVQQKAGPVAGTPGPGGIRVSDPSDPFELAAERNAGAIITPAPLPAHAESVVPSIQRVGDDEEKETAQTLLAQRQEDEDEEDQAGSR